jgi:hypothetical protein
MSFFISSNRHCHHSKSKITLEAILTQMGFDENTDLAFEVTKKGLLIFPILSILAGWER